jgi:uncharacterized membrane protein
MMWTYEKAKQKAFPLRTLLIVTYVLQIVAVYSIFMSDLYAPLEIVRQIAFIFLLTFIPGTFLLGFFRIKELDLTLAVVMIVGLSIFFIFACGLILMTIGFFTGVTGVITGSNLFLVILCLLNIIILVYLFCDCPTITYTRRKLVTWSDPFIYLAILIPVVSALGALIANGYQNSFMQYIALALIFAAIIYAGLSRSRDDRAYPWLLYGIALGLLLHTSFISSHIWGWDVHKEYYIASTVIQNARWDYDFYSNINAMLSIVVLVPTYSLICNLDLTTVFKLICPMLFAFAPLALFPLISRYASRWFAFMSLTFAVSFYAFYQEFPQLGRQEVALVFFTLVLALLMDTSLKMSGRAKLLLTVVFSFCLIVSHYGSTYMLLLLWIMALFIYLGRAILQRIGRAIKKQAAPELKKLERPLILNLGLLLAVAFMTILWYTSVTNASAFRSIVNIILNIAESMWTDLFSPTSAQGMEIITREASTQLHSVGKVVQLGAQGLIGLGILSLFSKKSRYHFPAAYTNLAVASFLVLVACIAVPNFASSLNTSRIIQVMLLVLAPMSIAGIFYFFNLWRAFTTWVTKRKPIRYSSKWITASIVLFLSAFLMFNTGLIYQVERTQHTSFALDLSIDYARYNDFEVMGQKWIVAGKVGDVYADAFRSPVFNEYYFWGVDDLEFIHKAGSGNLIYLGTYNIEHNTVRNTTFPYAYVPYNLYTYSTVYDNQHSMVQLN